MKTTIEIASQFTEYPERFLLWLEVTGNQPDDLSEVETLAEVEAETFSGQYANGAEFAKQIAFDTYEELTDLPTWITSNINWEDVWTNELRHDYIENETTLSVLIWTTY